MISHKPWSLDAKVLDAYIRNLPTVAWSDALRKYEGVLLPDGAIDAHASAFARAYRVRGDDESFACLRFWLGTAPASVLETYAAVEREHEVLARCGLSRAQLFSEAIEVDGAAIPAVLMDWVQGSALGDAVSTHLRNSPELLRIAESLRSTFVLLNDHRISHGDLRASNIMAEIGRKTIRVRLIDLDSLRWNGGPTSPREISGNRMWDSIRNRDRVRLLESDYLDQALTYLTVVAVAAEKSWWPGPTDGFLTFEHLRADSPEVLHLLEQMSGAPGRVAGAVRRVMEKPGHWTEVAEVMRNPSRGALTDTTFWGMAFDSRDSRLRNLQSAQPPAPKEAPAKVPQPVSNAPKRTWKDVRPPVQKPEPIRTRFWLWLLMVIATAVIVILVYWLSSRGSS
jgi:serine/threonine protein kinase